MVSKPTILSLILVFLIISGCGNSSSTGDNDPAGSLLSNNNNGSKPPPDPPTVEDPAPETADDPTSGSDETEEEENGTYLGKFKWTHYWIVFEDDFPGAKISKLVDWHDCSTIAWVSLDYYNQVKVEGTGFLSDGRLVNKYGDCPSACGMPGLKCFNEVDKNEAPYGHGSQDNPLRPYRSVAVDIAEIPFGTILYIPALEGVEMPDEHDLVPDAPFIHDGCVVAEDEGSSIVGKHLDFFSLTYLDYLVIDAAMDDIGEVDVYADAPQCL